MSHTARRIIAKQPGRLRKRSGATTASVAEIEVTVNGVRVPLSAELEAAVRRACARVDRPRKEMTTTQAARFLDVSRPFVIKLITQGDLPCRLVGKHRRIPSDALIKYREGMFHWAKSTADEMARTSQLLGLYESDEPRSQRRGVKPDMAPLVAVYDACVLYPSFLRDFLFRLAIHGRHAGVMRARWTGRARSGDRE